MEYGILNSHTNLTDIFPNLWILKISDFAIGIGDRGLGVLQPPSNDGKFCN